MVTFSERMAKSTLYEANFRFYKVNRNGTVEGISNGPVTPNRDGTKATLNPYGISGKQLAKNTEYKARVSRVKDLAGNKMKMGQVLKFL